MEEQRRMQAPAVGRSKFCTQHQELGRPAQSVDA